MPDSAKPDTGNNGCKIVIKNIPTNLAGNKHPGVTDLYLHAQGTDVFVKQYQATGYDQQWLFESNGGNYNIMSFSTGDYLTYRIPGRYKGSLVLQSTQPSHTWVVSPIGSDTVRISPSNQTGLAVDSCDQDTSHFWSASNGVHQKYTFRT